MQLTVADFNTARTYHFEANEKLSSINGSLGFANLGFDTLQMAAIPKMHFDSRECLWRHLTKTFLVTLLLLMS